MKQKSGASFSFLFLREDYTEDEARKMVALDEWLEKMREDAMRFPERQIVPPGTTDLADVKSQHEETLLAAAEAVYFENPSQAGYVNGAVIQLAGNVDSRIAGIARCTRNQWRRSSGGHDGN